MQLVNQSQNFAAGSRVEIAGGFVGKNHGRIESESPRDGHALPLAAGKLIRKVVEALAEFHDLKQFPRALVDIGARTVAGNLAVLPLTGVTFPFVSFGMTSLLVNMTFLALCLSVDLPARERHG